MGSAASSTNTNTTTTGRRLEGKVAIVTGGATGIGASTARLFNEHGAQVIIADIQDDLGRSMAEELGGNVSFLHCDVSEEDQVSALVDAAVAEYGKLDIMFNNAGVDADVPSILDEEEEEDVLERVLGVIVRGAFYGAKHATRVMGPTRRGCILFRSSSGNGSHLDVMSKYGIIGLTKNLSAEVGKLGIRVNCISHDQKNPRQEDQTSIARAALYLASDDANYISGHNLVPNADGLIQPTIPPLSTLS